MEKKIKPKSVIKWCLVLVVLLSIPLANALEYTTVADVFHNFSTTHNSECVYSTATETIIGNINATIDEVKLYNRALSASEISGEYNLKRDYFDSIPKEESGLSASENWDLYVSNGSISSCIVPSVNFDWTIIDECEKDNENIELGTGSLIIDADFGGKLILKNSAEVQCNNFQLLGSGEHINIFSGDIIT